MNANETPGGYATGVSVVLPTHNRAHVLARTIQSVLSQDQKEFELIVVDDGSTDGTPNVVRTVADGRVRYIRFASNRGANAARNHGVEQARFGLIAFADSDDTWLPHKLSTQLAVLRSAGPTTGLVFSPFRQHKNGQVSIVGGEAVGLPMAALKTTLLTGTPIGTPTVLVRKELLLRERFDTALPRLQEWELWLRLMQLTDFVGVQDALVDAFTLDDGISGRSEALLIAHRYILAKHYALFETAGREVLGARIAHLGHLEMLAGNGIVGRTLLLRGLRLAPKRYIFKRVALAVLGVKAYQRTVARRSQSRARSAV